MGINWLNMTLWLSDVFLGALLNVAAGMPLSRLHINVLNVSGVLVFSALGAFNAG